MNDHSTPKSIFTSHGVQEFQWVTYSSIHTTTPVMNQGVFTEFLNQILDPKISKLEKRDCPLFQCAVLKPGSTRGSASVLYHTALVGDYDEGSLNIHEAKAVLDANRVPAVFYETFSSKEDGPKWRVIIPLAVPLAPPDMRVYLARVNQLFGGRLSSESFVSGQAFFYGWKRGKDRFFEMSDPEDFLRFYDQSKLNRFSPLFPVLTQAEDRVGRRLFPDEVEDEIKEVTERHNGKLGTGEGRTELLKGYLVAVKRQEAEYQNRTTLTQAARRVMDDYFVDPATMQPERLVDWVLENIDFEPRSRSIAEAFKDADDEDQDQGPEVAEKKKKASDWKALRVIPQESGRPVEYTIDGFIPAGLSMIAAPWGAGKTSNLLPLAMVVAGMFRVTGITAEIRRKVVILSEDTDQVERILASLKRSEGWVSGESLEDWFYILPAVKHEPRALHKALVAIREELTYQDTKGFYVRPLVLLDTIPANIEVENENDNATVSRIAAAIKTSNTPTWGIGHTPKALVRADVSDMTFRGAGAWEADSMATLFLFYDEVIDRRVLALRKKRFGERYSEIHFGHGGFSEIVEVPWAGEAQEVKFIHGEPEVGSAQDRKDARQEATTERREEAKEDRRLGKISEVLDLITRASAAGRLMTKVKVYEELGGRKTDMLEIIRALVDAGQVQAVEIPDDLRPPRVGPGTDCLILPDLVPEIFFARVRQLGSSGRVQESEEDTDS